MNYLELVQRLQDAGLTEIEVTSFVSPKWVPQMADNAQEMAAIGWPTPGATCRLNVSGAGCATRWTWR